MAKRITSEDGRTREEQLSRMAEHNDGLQKQNPDSDFKTSSQWWAPSVNLGADLQILDKETNDKLNACIAKVFAGKFASDATAEARGEAKTILAGHPNILEQVDAVIFQNEQALAHMHEFAMSEAAAGRDVFGSCAAGQY